MYKRYKQDPEKVRLYREKCKRDKLIDERFEEIEKERLYQYQCSLRKRLHVRAGGAVHRAIKRGEILKTPCRGCGEREVDAHHYSYYPQDWKSVTFLCRKCHKKWHRENRPLWPSEEEIEQILGLKTHFIM